MSDRKADDTLLDNLADLPMQPTGSGVANLEIAYEQRRVAEAADPDHAAAASITGEEIEAPDAGDPDPAGRRGA